MPVEPASTCPKVVTELDVTAEHDGLGTVTLIVARCSLSPPTWRFETESLLGAGAQAEQIAKDARHVVTRGPA